MKLLLNLIIAFASVYLAIVLLVFFVQSHLIYFPQTGRAIVATPEQIGLAYESVQIRTNDGETLHGWYVPAPDAIGTVLFFHGNAGNISHRLDYFPMLHSLKLNTFILDYRGYGQSSGTPTEIGTYNDAAAAWKYLTEVKGIVPNEIVLYGESLGGAVAAWLAARKNPGLLVLASTFTSVPDLAETIYPFLPARWISRFEYNTLEYLESINCPIFVAHSPDDEIVPFSHGQRLFQAAAIPKYFLTLSNGHNDGFIFMHDEWIERLGLFIQTNLKPKY
ncbi:MAG: alpha/beta hydrolase [Burkholderiales bacterium]|nr:alpha/beta hydrolase [Nitrosomonas sp.]MCP5275646.1 alpha/beta hydrolase [Burkholderiales bacterium]